MKNTYNNILIVSNSYFNIYNFRIHFIKYLLSKNYNVTLIATKDKYFNYLKDFKVNLIPLEINTSRNLIGNFILILKIFKLMYNQRPDLVFSYTIKPNLYFSFVSRMLKINYINNFYGLGYLFINRKLTTIILEFFLKISIKNSKKIFFQNEYDRLYFINKSLVKNISQTAIVPGSGIDIDKFYFSPLKKTKDLNFLLISRMLWDKGINEFVQVAINLQSKYKNVKFTILGSMTSDNPARIDKKQILLWKKNSNIEFIDEQYDVRPFIIKSNCVILPSYREGTPKSLLEAMSMGRPIITTDVPGCNHLIQENKNGFLCKVRSVEDLQSKIIQFINLSYYQMNLMGKNSREIVLKKYTYDKVLKEYIKEL